MISPKAKDIMSADIITVDPEDTVDEVLSRMIQHGVSGLPVVDMAGQLVGIITEFDLLDLVWDPNTGKNEAYHYMTRDVRTVDEDDELAAVAEMFRILSVRRLLVMRGEQVVGIISRRDLIHHTLKLRRQVREHSSADC
ncbi:MAG TPA: CBS domain-containing protein [Thermoguttaceae bacterium]|nr:CBS domain-containing protein [Thermoguttaceae bacterium]